MSHIHWVPRQNKLETPKEKDKVKKREVHECDVRTRDPDAMVDTQKRKTGQLLPKKKYRHPPSQAQMMIVGDIEV